MALTNATVYTVSGPTVRNATVLIANGKIAAVGANVGVPANVRRLDLHGAVVIPGLVEARSSLLLGAGDLAGAGSADQSVLDAIDPFDEAAGKVLARGVTTLYLSPGVRGPVGGVGAVVKLRAPAPESGEGWVRVLRANAALDLAIGISTNGRSSSLERLSSYEALRSLFRSAQQYGKSLDDYDRDLKAYTKLQAAPKPAAGAGAAAAATPKPTKPRRSPAQDTALSALKGTLLVRIEAHRADNILNALRLIDEFHLKAVLESPLESRSLAREIARRGIPVVWGPTLGGPPGLDTRLYRPETAAALAHSGVSVALTTGSRSGLASRFLRENAALAVSYGLTPEQALKAITLDAARALGVADRVGSIEPGKDADLVVLSAAPMDPSARVTRLFIDGKEVALDHPGVSRAGSGNRRISDLRKRLPGG